MAPQCTSRSCWCSPCTSLRTSDRSELGRSGCSRVPRRWSACPWRRIPFFPFRNCRGYCCTNAREERSLVSAGLAGQVASTGPRTGSCCCSCKSAISVGEAWWSGPLGLPQCRTTPVHCTSASTQFLYTVSVPPDSSSTLSPGWCVTLLLPVLLAAARICRRAGWGVREADWKHE